MQSSGNHMDVALQCMPMRLHTLRMAQAKGQSAYSLMRQHCKQRVC